MNAALSANRSSPGRQQDCPVCAGECQLLGTVDFNKSCEEPNGRYLPRLNVPIRYLMCSGCGFSFAPDICAWPAEEFERQIYNERYVEVDPDYVEARPRHNAAQLRTMFGSPAASVRHLDYGGGNGLLSRLLRADGWNSISYDPLAERATDSTQLGRFDLITAFEVFEHVPDVQGLAHDLRGLLAQNGLVIFSTLTSDGKLSPGRPLTWWYASPRNGHISLYSRASLEILARQQGLRFGSFDEGMHVLFTTLPPWAAGCIRIPPEPAASG